METITSKAEDSSEIDRLDRRILATLQENGRITNLELADRTGLSPTATSERVKRLTRDGFIEGYKTCLSAKKLGLPLIVFVEVKLDWTSSDVFEAFAKAAKAAPEVAECHMVAGGFDYLVKARVRDMEAYRHFLSNVMLTLPGVRETHTYAVMEEVKGGDHIPV